jgi:hypothetical protein
VCLQSGGAIRKSFSGDTGLGETEAASDAAALSKLRGHWLLPAVGKPAAAAVLADLKVQRIADGERQQQQRLEHVCNTDACMCAFVCTVVLCALHCSWRVYQQPEQQLSKCLLAWHIHMD